MKFIKKCCKCCAKKEEEKAPEKKKLSLGGILRAMIHHHRKRKFQRRLFRFGLKLSGIALVACAAWIVYDQRRGLLDRIMEALPFGN